MLLSCLILQGKKLLQFIAFRRRARAAAAISMFASQVSCYDSMNTQPANTEILTEQTALSCLSSAQNQIKLFILEFNLQLQLPPIASIQQQQNRIQSSATNYKGKPFAFRSDTVLLLTPKVRPTCLPVLRPGLRLGGTVLAASQLNNCSRAGQQQWYEVPAAARVGRLIERYSDQTYGRAIVWGALVHSRQDRGLPAHRPATGKPADFPSPFRFYLSYK